MTLILSAAALFNTNRFTVLCINLHYPTINIHLDVVGQHNKNRRRYFQSRPHITCHVAHLKQICLLIETIYQ